MNLRPVNPPEPVLFVWAGIGSPDAVPDRIKVETCTECGGLVRTDKADQHGTFHRDLDRDLGRI